MNKLAWANLLASRCHAARSTAKRLASSYGDSGIYDVLEESGVTATGYRPPDRQQRHTELFELNKMFPDIVRHLTEKSRLFDVEDSNKWLAKALQYNMAGGRRTRGVSLVESLKILKGNDEKLLYKGRILAWCLEMVHTSVFMSYDALNRAETRYGKRCWYLNGTQGHDNWPRIIEAAVYSLLYQNFAHLPSYNRLIDLLHTGTSKAVMGQILEYETRSDPTLSLFTMERYSAITKYSISQIHFQLPVLLAMILAGIEDQEVYRQAKTILQEMAFLYQAQKDFLDCYGSSENSLKPSTGIEEGKCTWMSVVALQRVSDTQKKIFIDCYGKKDEKKVASVMEIYRLVGVTSTYKRFQEMNNELLLTQIQQVSRGLPHKLFLRFLNNPNRSTP